jgi:nucleoside-diphosphate-sugar epimerase
MAVKYLVSGGEGALGKTVISMLLQRGEKVRILMSELSDTRIYRNNPNIEICYGISTDKDSMIEFFDLEDPRSAILFHTDEYVSLSDSTNLTMRRVNVIGAENIVDMCLKRKVGKLVYLSSAYALNPEVKGEDLTIHFDRNKVEGEYAKSKAEAAAYVMEKVSLNRLNAVMVLPTFIIGPGYSEDYEINKVLNSYLNNGTIPPKQGGRAFVDVRDVANAMLTLADKGEPGAGYIVSGDYKTSGEFFQDVNEIQGNDAPVKTASKLVMSKSLAKLVDFYYKITHKENPKEAYTLFSDNPDARFEDNSKGVLPELTISFKDSLKDTIEGAQRGGVQAAAATQTTTERKTSADAMDARLKQQQSVTSKAHAASTSAETPMRPAAHTKLAAAAAAKVAARAAEAEKEENKSISPMTTLKDPEESKLSEEDEPKLNSETTFRFGGTPTKFTRVETPAPEKPKSIIPQTNKPEAPMAPEAPKAAEPAKSIIPPSAPKASEPAKSIIPPAAPKAAEAPKPSAPASSGFPRPGFSGTQPSATPAAETKTEPINSAFKAPEPKAKPAPSAGFPRAGGFARPQPSAAPAAPKAEPVQPINSAFKAPEPKAKPAPSAGFPRAGGFARPQNTPANNAARPSAAPSGGLSKSSEDTSSGGFLRQPASATTFPSPSAAPSAATKTEPINSAFKAPGASSAPANTNPFKSSSNASFGAAKEEPAKPSFGAAANSAAFAKEPSVDDLFNDLEKEIESYGSSDGPVVPPGIFAPPPKPGQ